MSLLLYKALASCLIFIVSILATLYPLKVRAVPVHHQGLELGDALASGIFLGAALFHMLPDATRDFALVTGNSPYPLAEFFCAAGFMLLLFLERLSGKQGNSSSSISSSCVFALIIIIHSFIEGAALGINNTLATTLILFIAIFAHKGSESFALAVILSRSSLSLKIILGVVMLFSIMTPLGIAFGTTLDNYLHLHAILLLTAGFNAFAAGTFLYMSTLHHINHHQREHHGEGLKEFAALCFGLVIMGVLSIWG